MPKTALGVVIATFAFALVAFGAPAPVLADGANKGDPKCQCRYQGQRYNLGEFACIRSKLARCDMFLNNTTWTFLDDSCGSVELDVLPQSRPKPKLASLSQTD
jgi:hypothetical protein